MEKGKRTRNYPLKEMIEYFLKKKSNDVDEDDDVDGDDDEEEDDDVHNVDGDDE